MKEIPIFLVRTNQAAIVFMILLSLMFQQPWITAGLWLIQTVGLISGGRWNLFVRIGRLFHGDHPGARTESVELQRFNNSIAVFLLTVSVAFFASGWQMIGYVFALIVAAAASAALAGFCAGCFIYYQYKQWKWKRSHA
ncbi:DUF4395 domain-containing protein [Ferviditalea candida]|uniref:DUF4395 domain-containing protein n=1 Tax=Ferviditalea candida TaxID=3108399 RepID=A0ABU5ZI27_9BACL|nr:DUF4395 domain-containing protein [Paenibacillaceae bacterium T2]